jgi:hypothetical protein
MADTANLGKVASINAIQQVGAKWADEDGQKAVSVLMQVHAYIREHGIELPSWVLNPKVDEDQSSHVSKMALSYLLNDKHDYDTERHWALAAVETSTGARAQVIDPIVGGGILIGLILASRVKKIGPDGVEFFPGIPDPLVKVLRFAKGLFGG